VGHASVESDTLLAADVGMANLTLHVAPIGHGAPMLNFAVVTQPAFGVEVFGAHRAIVISRAVAPPCARLAAFFLMAPVFTEVGVNRGVMFPPLFCVLGVPVDCERLLAKADKFALRTGKSRVTFSVT